MEREKFERVWQRVQGTSAPALQQTGEVQRLEERMTALKECALIFSWLQRHSAALSAAAAGRFREKTRQISRLQREYFLLTGDSFRSPRAAETERGMLSALQRLHALEEQSAAALQRASQESGTPRLRQLYAALAREEEDCAAFLRRQIDRLLA